MVISCDNIHWAVGLSMILTALQSIPSLAQTASGPMFSTPASRSTTGAPILNNSTDGPAGDILRSDGARRPSAPSPEARRPAASAVPDTVQVTARYKRWEMQCIGVSSSKKCQILGNVLSADGQQTILVMSLAPAVTAGSIQMQMAVPLGVAVRNGVRIDVGKGYSTAFKVDRCTTQGCIVDETLDTEMIDAMKKNGVATITVDTPDHKTIPIKFDIDGFSEALDALNR